MKGAGISSEKEIALLVRDGNAADAILAHDRFRFAQTSRLMVLSSQIDRLLYGHLAHVAMILIANRRGSKCVNSARGKG